MSREDEHEALLRKYLAAISAGPSRDELAQFFTADVVQHEFPNRLLPQGAVRDLAAILDASERGKTLLAKQEFKLLSCVVNENRAAAEADWLGVIGADIGPFKEGTQLRARFAMFFEFRDGKIARQHNYDCFEAW